MLAGEMTKFPLPGSLSLSRRRPSILYSRHHYSPRISAPSFLPSFRVTDRQTDRLFLGLTDRAFPIDYSLLLYFISLLRREDSRLRCDINLQLSNVIILYLDTSRASSHPVNLILAPGNIIHSATGVKIHNIPSQGFFHTHSRQNADVSAPSGLSRWCDVMVPHQSPSSSLSESVPTNKED